MDDGSITFEVSLDNKELQDSLHDVKKEIKAAEKQLEKTPEDTGLSRAIDNAKVSAGKLEKILAASSDIRREWLKSQARLRLGETTESSQQVNEMKSAMEEAETTLKALENQGQWFGDEEYDTAYEKLQKLRLELTQYKKDLQIPPKSPNPFGMDTYSGKIREAEIRLKSLEDAGKGLGDIEYDKSYRKLSLLRSEAKQYAAEIAKTPEQLQKEANSLEKAAKKAEELAQKEAEAASEAARLQEIKDNAIVADQYIVDLNNELSELKARLRELKKAGVGQGYKEYDQISLRIQEIIEELKQAANGASNVAEESKKISPEMEKVKKSAEKFKNRLGSMINRVFVFSVALKSLRYAREWFSGIVKSNDEATQAIGRLKGALLTMVQPLVSVIIPAFTTFVNILTRIVSVIASIVSSMFRTTAKESADAAKALNKQSKAIGGVGSAAEEAQKQMMPFDELNRLSDDSANAGGGGGVSSGIEPIFDTFDSDEYKRKIDELTVYVSGALLALGALLTFSGANIPLGLALMAAGAFGLVSIIQENWGALDGPLKQAVDTVLLILGTAFLVIGAFLAFSGANIPIGIALMAMGAAALVADAAINWDTIKSLIQENENDIRIIVSAGLLALGATLAFSGINLPLGIGLMAVGAAGLVHASGINWDTIVTALRGPIGTITAVASTALLALGIILCISGAGIPLGIALIAAGAAGLVTVVAVNWNAITEKVSEVWNSVKNFWNQNIAPVFTAEWWASLGRNCFNGFMGALESFINWALSGIGSMVNDITALLSRIPGINIPPVSWGHVQLPRLAKGAVIPPNREFMAVLGDQRHGNNIEAPEDLIRKIVREEAGNAAGEWILNVSFDGDLAQLIRLLAPKITAQQKKTERALGV